MRHALPLALLLALAACATPSQRIARKLGEFGVPQQQAVCMGDRLQQRLSVGQLRRLEQLSNLDGERISRMRLGEIAERLTDKRDPALIAEFLRAGVGCSF